MTKQFCNALLGFFSLCILLSAPVADAQEKMPEMQAFEEARSATDAIRSAAEAGGIAIPEGGLDGAKSTDLMYQTLKMVLGQPLANITQMTTNVDPEADSGPVNNPNVFVYLLSMMAGIGLVGTLVAALWTILESMVSVSTSAKMMSSANGNASPFAFMMSRTAISSVLNVPLPMAGGMAASQVFMIFAALIGIGLGSALFYAVASRMINQPLITYNSPKQEIFFIEVSKSLMCLAILDRENNQFLKSGQNGIYSSKGRIDGVVEEGYIKFGRNGECGRITFELKDERRSEPRNPVVSFIAFDSSGDIIQTQIESIYKAAVWDAFITTLSNPSFQSVMRSIISTEPSNLGFEPTPEQISQLRNSYKIYKSNLEAAIFKLDESINTCSGEGGSSTDMGCANKVLLDSISKYGFMLAGTYSYVLNQRQSQISWAIEDTVPEVRVDFSRTLSRLGIDEGEKYYTDFFANMNSLDIALRQVGRDGADSVSQNLNLLYESTTSDSGFAEMLGDALYSSMRQIVKVGYLGKEASFNNPEPITQLATIGNTMMALPFLVIGAEKLLPVKYSLIGSLKNIAGKTTKFLDGGEEKGVMSMILASLLSSFLQAIVVGGFFLSIVVPAIPYVIWNMAIFGYISYVLLVVIGVPIMVAAKPLKDGEGFVGGVKTGYQMAFNLIIRPSAMITGLVLAMVLSRVFSWFINATYFESFQIAHSGGFSMAAAFGVPFMYAMIQLTAIYKSYSMINEVPAFIAKMTESDRAHTDIGDEKEQSRLGSAVTQSGQSVSQGLMSGMRGA